MQEVDITHRCDGSITAVGNSIQAAHPGVCEGEVERGQHDADGYAAFQAPNEDGQEAQHQEYVLCARDLEPSVH